MKKKKILMKYLLIYSEYIFFGYRREFDFLNN